MAYSYEELQKHYHNLGRIVLEQEAQLDELIAMVSGKFKKSSRHYIKEKEHMEMFLRKSGVFEEYKEFKNQLRDSSKSKG
jgi:uncharacterized protein YbgA (DUF1722 family)